MTSFIILCIFLVIIFSVLYFGGIIKTDRIKNSKQSASAFFKSFGLKGIGAVLLILCLLNSFYTVSETETAVVTMFGKVQSTEGAGVHFKLPFIQHAQKVDISTHGASIGYAIEGSTQTYGNYENPQMITSDFNLINVDFYLEYKVNDPVAYLYNSMLPERILNDTAMSAIRATVSDYPVDDVMTTAKGQIQQQVKERLTKELESQHIGLQVINVLIQDVEPPTIDVMNAFKAVETAKQGADTAVNNAKKYQNEQLPKAEAEADRIVQAAEATKQSRIAEAEGQVSRFNKMYEEYIKFPTITKQRIFFETMEDVLPNLDVIITDGNTQSYLPINQLQQTFNSTNTTKGGKTNE